MCLNSFMMWRIEIKILLTNISLIYLWKQCYLVVSRVEKLLEVKWCFLWKWAAYDSKKSKFIKEKETRGLLIKLVGIKASIFSDLPTANILFLKAWNECNSKQSFISRRQNHTRNVFNTVSTSIALVHDSLKIKINKGQLSLKKQLIQNIFIKRNWINLVFNMI